MLKFKSIISKPRFSAGHSHSHHEVKTVANFERIPAPYDHLFLNEKNGQGEHPAALHNILLKFRKPLSGLIQAFHSISSVKTVQQSEYWNPPKIHENSVFVHQSNELANTVRLFRGAEYLGLAFVAGLSVYPVFSIFAFAGSYAIWSNAWFYEMSRRLVCRMDLLPHLEMVSVQRVGAFGKVYNKLIRTQDLEKVSFEELNEKENYFWYLQTSILDKNLIFRDKTTGELLCFDRKGLWNHDGLNHELLN